MTSLPINLIVLYLNIKGIGVTLYKRYNVYIYTSLLTKLYTIYLSTYIL